MPITHLLAQSLIMELESDPANNKIEEERVVLIDTDGSTDDAWAIFMALAAHRNPKIPFRLVGITCSHGVSSVDTASENVANVLHAAHEANIPVFRGCESALVYPMRVKETSGIFVNGFRGAGLPVLEKRTEPEHAVNAIIELAQLYNGNLNILCLGPLTNLAMALKMKPGLKNMLKDVYILGGNHQAMGNASPNGEFHFLADAEAAHIVLQTLGHTASLNIIPWETCANSQIPKAVRNGKLGAMYSEEIALLNAVESHLLQEDDADDSWISPGSIAAAVIIEPEITKAMESYNCTVELHGAHSRGMMVVDKNFMRKKPSNCAIVKYIDMDIYEKMLVWAAGGPYYKDKKPSRNS